MRKLLVREMCDDEMEQVLMCQVIHLPFPCETQFIVKEKKDLHYVKFSNGEVFLFLHLVEVGGHPNTAPRPPPAVSVPPASILYVSNSVAPNMDELTHNVSEWDGVSVPTTHQSQCSHGGSSGSRMEWTWRPATESNMPNSPKLTNSVQEVFHEVSEPNPIGNAVTSEETHGNAVAGAAAASSVTQPPVDTASLACSSTNKHHCTRHASSGQSHCSSPSVPLTGFYPSPKTFWSCTHVNICQKYTFIYQSTYFMEYFIQVNFKYPRIKKIHQVLERITRFD